MTKIPYTGGATRNAIDTRMSLIPMDALLEIGRVMAKGAIDHGDNNWRGGIPDSVLMDHALRHIALHCEGDTTEPHLAHATCSLLMAIHFKLEAEGSSNARC